jgi:hypothetical protein
MFLARNCVHFGTRRYLESSRGVQQIDFQSEETEPNVISMTSEPRKVPAKTPVAKICTLGGQEVPHPLGLLAQGFGQDKSIIQYAS